MSLLGDIMEDIRDITGDADEFGVSITVISPAPTSLEAAVVGLASKHHWVSAMKVYQ